MMQRILILVVLLAGSYSSQARQERPAPDHRAQFIASVAEAQGAADDRSDNSWLHFDHAVASLTAAVRFFVVASEALREYEERGGGRRAIDMLSHLTSPDRFGDPEGVLRREGERFMAAMDHGGWWESLTPVREAEIFVPPRHYGSLATPGRAAAEWGGDPGTVMKLCLARMRREIRQHRLDTAAVAMEDALALCRAASWWGEVGHLRREALKSLNDTSSLWHDNPGFARSLLEAIGRQPHAPARVSVDRQRYYGLEALHFQLAAMRAEALASHRRRNPDVPDREVWAILGEQPPPEQAAALNAIADATIALHEATGDIDLLQQRLDGAMRIDDTSFRLARVFAPRADLFHHQQLRAAEAAARIGLALEIHRAASGEYPVSLAELDALARPLSDPWSGGPLRYIRGPGGGAMVYSTGRDGVDNGGRENGARPRAPEWDDPRGAWEGFDLILYRAPGP